MCGLRERYTIVIVTHNMAQARRASDECIFMLLGELIEHGPTEDIFLNPKSEETESTSRAATVGGGAGILTGWRAGRGPP